MGERGAVNVTFEEIEFRDWLENVGEREGGGRRRLKMVSKFTLSPRHWHFLKHLLVFLNKRARTHTHACTDGLK